MSKNQELVDHVTHACGSYSPRGATRSFLQQPQDRDTHLKEKMPTKQTPTRQAITLKGSTSLVTEFFKYAANTSVSPSINRHFRSTRSPLAFFSNVEYIQLMTSIWSRNTGKLCLSRRIWPWKIISTSMLNFPSMAHPLINVFDRILSQVNSK